MRLTRPPVSAPLLFLTAAVALATCLACGGGPKVGGSTTPTASSPTVTVTVRPTLPGTPDPALQPYFTQLDAIFQQASDSSATANEQLSNALADAGDVEQQKVALDAFLETTEGVFNTAIAAMDQLTVPNEGRIDHDAFVTSARASQLLASRLRDSLDLAQTDSQVEDLLNEFDSNKQPLLDAADRACIDLQDIANAYGIEVDLVCTG